MSSDIEAHAFARDFS